MFGITIPDLLRFVIQVSVALAGASSLWGALLVIRARRARKAARMANWQLARILAVVFCGAFVVFLVSWWLGALVFFPPEALSHEGIKIDPSHADIVRGFGFNIPFVVALMLVGIGTLLLVRSRLETFKRYALPFFGIQFLLASAILVFSVFVGHFDRHQAFFSFHNWHSILTLGSVIVVDILYLATFYRDDLKRVLYPFFPYISMGIWIGLGIDFASVVLVFDEAFVLTQQFFFSQTVIAIIILNGALLSERITDALIANVEKGVSFSPRFERIFGLSGAISIVSWTTITFVDFFTLTLTYGQMIGIWLAAIVVAYVVHVLIDRALARRAQVKMA